MVCESCNNSKKSSKDFTRAVIEINNPDKLVLLRKVVIPASMGTKDDFPPTIGKYYNTLLQYEASGDLYLYSSDGIPTQLSSDVSELQRQLEQLGLKVDKEILDRITADAALNNSINTVSGSLSDEVTARQNADNALQGNITALDNSLATVAKSGSYNDLSNKPTIGNATLTIKKNGSNVGTFTANATANKNIDISVPTKTSDLTNDGSDGASQYVESDDLATVATSGSYNDLSNKPTIGNATLTIKRNDTNAGTFTANATTNKSINIAVPTKTSDLTNDGADGASTYVESDDLPTVDTTYSSSSNNAIANSTVTNSLDRNVMTNLALDSTPSTTTINLNNTKTNLAHPSSTTTSSISLPVASSTQAGVMNSSTFDAIASNTSNINAILSGAVAITGLPASPTQAELTTAWENETGLTSLMNRAGIYDVTNSKVWTYYTNDSTWYAASNTSQVTVSTFTNSSEGLIKGSTNDGQVFAENDGTGSVNGWDTLTSAVSNNTSKLATIAQGAEVNVQANWTQTNTSADDYIKNKPANLVQDANYVHTDNNFTTTLKNKLDGVESGAEVNVQADWTQSNTSADDYIKNKPTIPTVNNATLTIQKNGTNVQTFTANSSTNKTANITVPTAVSELTNDANYATTTQLNDGLATKQNTLTAGSNITIANDTISATDTTYTAGNAINITNNVISADIHPADFFTAGENVSGEGANTTLNNTIQAKIKSVQMDGDTYQQTYSGKNLYDLTLASTTNHGITGSGTTNEFTFNGTANAEGYRILFKQLTLPAGTYTATTFCDSGEITGASVFMVYKGTSWTNLTPFFAMSFGSSDIGTSKSASFTLSEETTVSFCNYFNKSDNVFPTYTNLKGRFQLESGSTATSYEPYVGGIPAPNPDYPQDVQTVTGEQTVTVTGKNLFNIDTTYRYGNTKYATVYNGDGTVTSTANFGIGRSAGALLTLAPETTYTLSATLTMASGDDNNNYGAIQILQNIDGSTNTLASAYYRKAYGDLPLSTNVTFTTPRDVSGIWISFNGWTSTGTSSATYSDVQIEKGTTATPYEPFQGQTYIIDLRGKNLLNISDFAMGGLSNGNPTTMDYRIQNADHPIAVQPNTTYTLSAQLVSPVQGFRVGVHECRADGSFISDSGWKQLYIPNTFTTGPNTYFLKIVGSLSTTSTNVSTGSTENTTACTTVAEFMRGCTLMLEKGSTATTYEPYNAIELCKIGEYQDYIFKNDPNEDWYNPDLEDNAWYVHKEVRHLSLAIADMNNAENFPGWRNVSELTQDFPPATNINMNTLTDSWDNITGVNIKGSGRPIWGANNLLNVLFADRNFFGSAWTQTYWKTNYPNLVLELYYGILNPITDTQITDATLIGQLDALWNANTYLDTTHFFVTATGSNLPVILDIEAYRKSLNGVLESIPDAQVQSNWTQADSTAVDYIKNKPSLATVATTGSYNDLANKPTIPTVNNATLTIKENGSTVTTFTANSSTNQTADISVPVVTMTTTDPGEGSPLAANNFIGVYE